MIIKIEDQQFDVCFKMISKDARHGGITVLIFVAYDCDAICACHILTVRFESYFLIISFARLASDLNSSNTLSSPWRTMSNSTRHFAKRLQETLMYGCHNQSDC